LSTMTPVILPYTACANEEWGVPRTRRKLTLTAASHIDLTTPNTPPLQSTRVIGVSQAVARHNAAPFRINYLFYLVLAEILGPFSERDQTF
jgi:hypothetical protein